MKKVIVLVGPNGVGKSTTAEAFMHQHPKCAYIDSDACRAMNPFPLTPATKEVVIENIKRAMTDGRDKERIDRGIKNTFNFYDVFNEPSIDTTNLSPKEVVNQIQAIMYSYN